MRCTKCGADNREGRKFCAKYAALLACACPQCGAANEPSEDFCGECAAPLGQWQPPSTKKSNHAPILVAEAPAPESLDGERKTVTALFADIKGSMELIEDLDPEEARAIVDPALKLMIDAVQRYGGYVAQSTGDGIFALFGAPVAYEDNPQRALYAALRMQEELRRYSDGMRSRGRLPVQVRVGVNSGEVVVQEMPDPSAQKIDPQIRTQRMGRAIKRVVINQSLVQPTVAIFEDLHWIDDETQALLDLLADSIANTRVLLLVNSRPEYSHQWTNKTYYIQLRLDPLGCESAEAMIDNLLGPGSDLAELKHFITERTEGNPFFMEEIVRALFEDGSLHRNGATRLDRPLASFKMPATVQAVLASRVDRLPAKEKELLQTLAVMGREFPLSLVCEVTKASVDELDHALHGLQLAEFIYERPAIGDVEYIFKHALTQQVARDSLLLERRRIRHEKIGDAIETLYGERLQEYLPELAHHYMQSRNIEKAVHFLRLAAEQAAGRSALAEAESYLRNAIALLATLPTSVTRDAIELGLQTALGGLLIGKSFGASRAGRTAEARIRTLSEGYRCSSGTPGTVPAGSVLQSADAVRRVIRACRSGS